MAALVTDLSPTSQSPQPFFEGALEIHATLEKIRRLGAANFQEISALFHPCFLEQKMPANIALLITGSDARFERTTSLANAELIIVTKDSPGQDSSPMIQTAHKIRECIARNHHFFLGPEEKKLVDQKVSLFTCEAHGGGSSVERPIFTRALDAQFVGGDPSLFAEYKQQLASELAASSSRQESSGGKTIRISEFRRHFFTPSVKELTAELEATMQKEAKEQVAEKCQKEKRLGIELGMLVDDGRYTKGPKYGILRGIQYSLALCIAHKAPSIAPEEWVRIPARIPDRIAWLQQKKLLPLTPSETETLKHCYIQALDWYYQLESEVARRKESDKENVPYPVTLNVDPALSKALIETTLTLIKKIAS